MEYKRLENVKLPVSRMVFKTAVLAMKDRDSVFELLDAVYAAGINTFVSARSYGMAEKSLGDWIAARGNRSEVVLLSMGAHSYPGSDEARMTPDAIRKDLEESLRMLQTDFIDIYLLHGDDNRRPVGPLVETLNELREEGKIGVFGGSNWSVKRLDEANEYAYAHDLFGFEVSSPAYSLLEQANDSRGGGCVSISGDSHARERKWYMDKGIEVFSYAGLAHGFLSGKFKVGDCKEAAKILNGHAVRSYFCPENLERLRRAEQLADKKRATVPQIALAWLLHQPLQPMIVFSAATAERVADGVKAIDLSLSQAEIRYLNG